MNTDKMQGDMYTFYRRHGYDEQTALEAAAQYVRAMHLIAEEAVRQSKLASNIHHLPQPASVKHAS